MNVFHAVAERTLFALLWAIATWWIVAPRSYVTCIRKVPWLWMSVYPSNTRNWFPLCLRAWGVLLWVGCWGGFLRWYNIR
jgi:hypothetical protein